MYYYQLIYLFVSYFTINSLIIFLNVERTYSIEINKRYVYHEVEEINDYILEILDSRDRFEEEENVLIQTTKKTKIVEQIPVSTKKAEVVEILTVKIPLEDEQLPVTTKKPEVVEIETIKKPEVVEIVTVKIPLEDEQLPVTTKKTEVVGIETVDFDDNIEDKKNETVTILIPDEENVPDIVPSVIEQVTVTTPINEVEESGDSGDSSASGYSGLGENSGDGSGMNILNYNVYEDMESGDV